MAHYKNHSIVVQDNADSASVIIGSLTQVSTPIDSEVLKEETGGKAYPDQISVVSQKPRCSFTTFDLPKVITAFGLNGRYVIDGVAKPGFAITQAQYGNGGVVVSGTNHRRLRFARSYNRINRISVSHRQDAQAECESVAVWDSTNDPVVIEASQALPTLPASPGRWTIHALSVGGIDILCNTQVDIDFGISVDAFGCDDEIYDTHVDVTQIAPMVTITSLDPTNFADAKVLLEGLIGTQANSSLILRERVAHQAAYKANDASTHIKIDFAGVLLATDAHNASGNSKAQSTFRMEVAYDGTNAPFVFALDHDIA